MIDGLTLYLEYKAAVVPWLEKIPAHWTVEPGFAAYREKQQKNIGMIEKRVLSLSYGRIVIKPEDKLHGLVPESFETYQIVNPGDIIIRSTDLQNDWTSLRVGLVRERGIITSAYLCLKMVGLLVPEYGYLQLHAFDLMKVFYGMGSGLRQNLDFSDFKRMPVLVPPHEEQTAIVRFLNHANRRIERYVRAKKKLVALLNEQKQVIVHRAVTRGLDPHVRLKPSGIPWLGDMPEHWDIVPLGRCVTRIEQGWSPVAAEGEPDELQWVVLTLSSVRRGAFDATAIKPVSKDASVPERIEVRDGDFLLTRSNTRDRVGDVCVVEGVRPKTILCDLIYRLSVNGEIMDSRFLMFQLLAPLGRGQIEKDARGSSGTMPKISQRHIKSWRVVLPPIKEQRKIFDIVKEGLSSIDATIERAIREISLLREYRTRLVADVVTGKLDVRAAAARLPDEVKELEPIDEGESVDEQNGNETQADIDEVGDSGRIG